MKEKEFEILWHHANTRRELKISKNVKFFRIIDDNSTIYFNLWEKILLVTRF